MEKKQQQLHFLMIPLMSQSHIIPLTDFAKSLARRGAYISIVTTPLNARRYSPTHPRIQMLPLHFPCSDAGLPHGCENLDTLSSLDLAYDFFRATKLLQTPLETLIRSLDPTPHCIISTSAISWTHDVADKFRIPHYVFETVSCFTLHCSSKVTARAQETLLSDSDPFLVPDIPHAVVFTKDQLPTFAMKKDIDRARPQGRARGTLVNTFHELEPWYVEGCREDRGDKVWSVGPVSLSNRDSSERYRRGNEASIDEHYCLTWLDSMPANSVIYACFGSLCSLSANQIAEIGLGLEESNHPFIWIIRKQEQNSEEVERWMAAERYEERVRGRGLVVRGWAPQVTILSHPSVGGFLTHCGWNSTLEGITAGVPMMTWPMFAEQFYNEKLVVDVLGIGVRVGVESCIEKQGLVKKERVKLGVKKLMSEDKDGVERRKRCQEYANMGSDAFQEGGSSFLNVTLFMQDVVMANFEMLN